MSGGVRNLRAMFENKDTADPPDRGRSPAGSASIGIPSTGTSPRPLSKVRTNFVTVERPGEAGGQLGLRKESGGEPSVSSRRASFTTDQQNPKDIIEKKTTLPMDSSSGKPSSGTEAATVRESESVKGTTRIEADKKVERLGGVERGRELVKPVVTKPEEKVTATYANGNGTGKSTAIKPAEKPVTTKASTKPPPISVVKASTAPKASPKNAKTPTVPRTPTTPRGRAKEVPAKAAESKPVRAPAAASKPTSRQPTTATQGSAPKTRIQASPQQTGFKKPKPRSPTRPIKLPASLTAHTASSGSKTTSSPPSAARRSLSRASGNSQPTNSLQAHHAVSRSPSRASATTSKSTLARKPSNLNKTGGRPSLGPPPAAVKKQPSRASLSQQQQPATPDDSFLARMMRPTTSSASKTTDTTPPKRGESIKRPVTREGTLRARDSSKGSPAPKVRAVAPVNTTVKQAKPVAKEVKVAVPPAAKAESESKPKLVAQELGPEEKVEVVETKKVLSENNAVDTPPAEVVKAPAAVDEVKAAPEVTTNEEVEVVEDPVIPETLDNVVGDDEPAAIPQFEHAPTPERSAMSPGVEQEPVIEEEEAASEQQGHEASVQPAVEQEGQTPPVVAPEIVKEEVAHAAEEPTKDALPQPELVPSPEESKTEIVEDPEDAKAREEIARLNSEFSKAAAEKEGDETEVD